MRAVATAERKKPVAMDEEGAGGQGEVGAEVGAAAAEVEAGLEAEVGAYDDGDASPASKASFDSDGSIDPDLL